MKLPRISAVIPCYNELENIEPLVAELQAALDPTGHPYEIIYVDDFSADGSSEKLVELATRMPFLRVFRHKQNLGESAAILSGYEQARGDIVITMDADLQNDPADIPEMLKLLENVDAVCGVRARRQDSTIKKMSSRVANKVRHWLLNDGIHDAGCTLRVVRRHSLNQLPGFRGLHRFLPTILKIHGFHVLEMPVNHRPRTRGVSKYGIGNRLWVGIADIMGMRWYRKRHFPPNRLDDRFPPKP